ncbi:IS200/IS605 family transposase [Candidatus Sororendozoicomonas aggregata]|uniref:IS200/IS605 family transposase n=1 Tax=Candidatus Sororendozoicomonas aggregata TaxID=3073239 RepID=UPI002ECFDA14
MRDYKSLAHTRWDCKYHIVFIPKRRRKVIYGNLRKFPEEIFHELARRKNCKILEGHLMSDHIHMCVSISPKYPVSHIASYLKEKCAIEIAKNVKGKQRNFSGEHFWARGYFVSTVGLDEDMVRRYIRDQEKNDANREQYDLDW